MTVPSRKVPRPVLLLGWLGVAPFAAASAATVAGVRLGPFDPRLTLCAYGAAILSFMGGVRWGAAMMAGGSRPSAYAISVLPALTAWVSLLLAPTLALAVQIGGFAALLAYDLQGERRGETPPWYGRLRTPLTATVIVCLTAPLLPSAWG